MSGISSVCYLLQSAGIKQHRIVYLDADVLGAHTIDSRRSTAYRNTTEDRVSDVVELLE